MSSPLVVVVRLVPRPETREELIEVFRRFSPGVHAERGCERFALHTGPDAYFVVERWENREIWEEHLARPENAELNAALTPLLAEPADVWDLDPVLIGDPLKSFV